MRMRQWLHQRGIWWHSSDDRDDIDAGRDRSRTIPGTTLALPSIGDRGRFWVYGPGNRSLGSVEWGYGQGVGGWLALGLNMDGDERSLNGHVRLPWIGYLFWSLNGIIPDRLIPKKTVTFTTYEPYVFPAGHVVQPGERKPVQHTYERRDDVKVGFSWFEDHLTWELFNVSEHMQSDGKRRGSLFVMDALFGRTAYANEKIGPPVQAVACFPEGQYTLTLQREVSTWKRQRWPWSYVRKSVDITLEKPPEFHGKGENSWDCGPDAIYGMSSEGHRYEDAVAAYTKAVLRERSRRGHLAPEHRSILEPAS